MNNFTKIMSASALTLVAALSASAETNTTAAILIGADNIEAANAQEQAAARFFTEKFNGEVFTPATLSTLDAATQKVLWIHIDRLGIGSGFANLPAEFNSPEVIETLNKYLADGGNIYLSKHATQMMAALNRLPENFLPGIFGDGDGGAGTDVWTVNAHFGSMQFNAEEPDMTQVYDRRGHAIFEGLQVFEAGSEWTKDYPHDSFPMLGSGDGTPLHREDHNCMWDLNAYNDLYTAEGKNTLEKFEAQFDCTLLATWGHVQDYCVAGIVEFNPTETVKGRIIANGLAACEWAPRSGVNAYHSNLEKLTENTLVYLGADNSGNTGISFASSESAPAAYYTLQGTRVENPSAGLFIVVKDGRASKVVLK